MGCGEINKKKFTKLFQKDNIIWVKGRWAEMDGNYERF